MALSIVLFFADVEAKIAFSRADTSVAALKVYGAAVCSLALTSSRHRRSLSPPSFAFYQTDGLNGIWLLHQAFYFTFTEK